MQRRVLYFGLRILRCVAYVTTLAARLIILAVINVMNASVEIM
jgi:hypothetical protein